MVIVHTANKLYYDLTYKHTLNTKLALYSNYIICIHCVAYRVTIIDTIKIRVAIPKQSGGREILGEGVWQGIKCVYKRFFKINKVVVLCIATWGKIFLITTSEGSATIGVLRRNLSRILA